MADAKFLDKTMKQKITMERNIHATYYYLPDKDLFEVHCSLNDYGHDVTVIYLCDLNKGIVENCEVKIDITPESSCRYAPTLCKKIEGMNLLKGFSANVLIEMLGKNGCENIAELLTFSGSSIPEIDVAAVKAAGYTTKKKLQMTRNMHSTYYYVPDKDAYEVACILSDDKYDVTARFLCDMNADKVVSCELFTDVTPCGIETQMQEIAQKVVGIQLKHGFMANVFMLMMGSEAGNKLAEMFSFSGSAIAFVWVRNLCESGKLGWDQFLNTIFPMKINTCIAFNPTFNPKDIGAEEIAK